MTCTCPSSLARQMEHTLEGRLCDEHDAAEIERRAATAHADELRGAVDTAGRLLEQRDATDKRRKARQARTDALDNIRDADPLMADLIQTTGAAVPMALNASASQIAQHLGGMTPAAPSPEARRVGKAGGSQGASRCPHPNLTKKQ